MIRLKFSTKEEALSYKEHFKLIQFSPEETNIGFAADRWFDGGLGKNKPEIVGFREIETEKKIDA